MNIRKSNLSIAVLLVASWSACIGYGFAQQKKSTVMNEEKMAPDRYEMEDKSLNTIYKQLLKNLNDAQKQKLRDAQRSWITFRDANSAFVKSLNEQDTPNTIRYLNALSDVIAHRTMELETYNADFDPESGFQHLNLAWAPDMDQPIRQLDEVLETMYQQQPMNFTIGNISFLYDAKLFIIFYHYIEKLSVQQRDKAIAEQNAWLKQRKVITKQAYDEYAGGTLAPYTGAEAKIKETKARIKQIEQQYVNMTGNSLYWTY